MIKSITSAQNQWVKDVLALQEKAKNRRTAGQFTVEGINEIRLAMKSGLVVKQLAINPDKMSWKELKTLLNVGQELDATWMIEVLGSAWSKVVVRESGQNALAIFEMPSAPLEWKPKPGGLYLLVESVEKPGNLGALLRSADATAADGVVICDERIDAYHPQVIRNSVDRFHCTIVRNVGPKSMGHHRIEKSSVVYHFYGEFEKCLGYGSYANNGNAGGDGE